MRWLSRALRPITHPVIVSKGDLRRYVARVTVTATVLALFLDIDNQLLFFTDWETAFRSWTLTAIDVVLVSVPIALLIARSQRELYKAKREVETLSRTDALTGLPNRRAIMDEVACNGSAVMVLVIVDIDRFKSINDGFGHRTGDLVLQTIAGRMRAELEEATLVGRLGGEEFAVLSSAEAAGRVLPALDALRERLANKPVIIDGVVITVTISAGAAIRAGGEPFDQLYTEADAALYRAKNNGRNQIVLSPRLAQHCGGEVAAAACRAA